MYSVKMFLKYVNSHTTLKMQCSLSHSLVQYLALKSDTANIFLIIILKNSLVFVIFPLWRNTFRLVPKSSGSGLAFILWCPVRSHCPVP